MLDFTGLLDYAFAERLYDSAYHGLEHWHQVEFNGLLLASKTGADITVVRLFALFHDCRRMDDAYDGEHGPRAVEFIDRCIAEKRLELADTDKSIQGYSDGVFWERNTAALQKK